MLDNFVSAIVRAYKKHSFVQYNPHHISQVKSKLIKILIFIGSVHSSVLFSIPLFMVLVAALHWTAVHVSGTQI